MLKKILIAVAVVGLALVGLIATRPATFSVARSSTIHAPAPVVYAQIADFHKWNAWSPWDKMDPTMKRTYSGADAGKGAVYEWVGNDQVGSGKMEVVNTKEPAQVSVRLTFLETFPADNHVVFDVVPKGEDVAVTWTMTGDNSFISKAFQFVMPMDKMVGSDIEKGLTGIKTVAEAKAQAAAKAACHGECTDTKTRTVKVCDNDDCTRSHTETEDVCSKWAKVCDDPPDHHAL